MRARPTRTRPRRQRRRARRPPSRIIRVHRPARRGHLARKPALEATAAVAPGTGNELIDRIGELTASLRERGEGLLAALSPQDARYRSTVRASLIRIIDDIEDVAATAGALDPYLSASLARLAADRVGEVLDLWGRINAAIDAVVVRVLRGEVDRNFQLLSPVANSQNLRGRRRLTRIYEGLSELAGRGAQPEAPAPPAKDEQRAAAEADDPLHALVPPPPEVEPGSEVEEEEVALLFEAHPQHHEELNYTAVFDDAAADTGGDSPFEECMARLGGPHEIDRSDALIELLRRHQHQLVAHLIRGAAAEDPMLEQLLEVLWRNVEVVVLDDFFFSARRSKLTGFLELAEPYPVAARFRRLLRVLRPGPAGYPAVADAVEMIEAHDPEELRSYLRALVLHPLEEYRRYAAARLEPSDLWTIISFPQTPLPALATIVERLADEGVGDDYRKVFFDCTLKTLALAREEDAVRAARRVLSTLFTFDFFLEDEYFRKIIGLNQIIDHEEKRSGRSSGYLSDNARKLRKQKAQAGDRATKTPSFDGVPLTVQRLLAREGFHTLLFVSHPDAKIALETLRHLQNPGLAEKALRHHTINTMLLTELARRDDLLSTRGARLALLSNPHTPLRAVYGYVPLMSGEDLRRLAISRDVNGDVSAYLLRLLQRKGVRVW